MVVAFITSNKPINHSEGGEMGRHERTMSRIARIASALSLLCLSSPALAELVIQLPDSDGGDHKISEVEPLDHSPHIISLRYTQGDEGETESVDHWLYFASSEDAQKFLEYLNRHSHKKLILKVENLRRSNVVENQVRKDNHENKFGRFSHFAFSDVLVIRGENQNLLSRELGIHNESQRGIASETSEITRNPSEIETRTRIKSYTISSKADLSIQMEPGRQLVRDRFSFSDHEGFH